MTRVLFLGGKDIGCYCLENLLYLDDVEVVGVFVNPTTDVIANRWYKSATEIAFAYNIPTYALHDINSDVNVHIIRELAPDLIVVVYYDQILKRDIIDIPRLGCVNLHFGLSEEYRGCYPTTWAILNNETRTGITLHYINEGIDTGDIIAQRFVNISEYDTGESLYRKCTSAGERLFAAVIPSVINGTADRRSQKTIKNTKYYRRDFPSQEIDFNIDGKDILKHIRAVYFPPFPLPYFYLGGRKMVVIEESRLTRMNNALTDYS